MDARNRKLFSVGLGGMAVVALIAAAGYQAAHREQDSVAVRKLAPVTFHDMERPDPRDLLTPVRLPGRASAHR